MRVMTDMKKSLALFSGTASPEFAQRIADELGEKLGDVKLEKFSNGEIYARYNESVRGSDVFIIQTIAGEHINDSLMELLIMADAAKRASARTITAIVPNYGYARQDRKAAAREPITAKLVANMITVAGFNRIMTMDLHQSQIQGFFEMPVDHLTALPVLADYIAAQDIDRERLCIVSPDVGRAKAAKKISDRLNADLAIMHKGRPQHNQAEITALIGDVKGKTCILNDDMIDTGGSVVAAVDTLYKKGAEKIYVCCTHPVFSGPGLERMQNLNVEEVVVTDTIPIPPQPEDGRIKVVSVAPMFANAISTVYSNGSVSDLFDEDFSM